MENSTIHASAHMGLKGEFKCILWNADGTKALETDYSSNLILDSGLTIFGRTDKSFSQYCYIGDDGTAPTIADVTLGNRLGGRNDSTGNSLGASDYPRPPVAPDWERYSGKYYRFNAGNGTGTIREIGIGANPTTDTELFCRHVLPVPIVKNADQTLDVFYKFTVYMNNTPSTGSVSIGGVDYDWEIKPIDRDAYNYSIFAQGILQNGVGVYSDASTEGTDTALPSGTGQGSSLGNAQSRAYGLGYSEAEWITSLDGGVTPQEEIRYFVIYNNTYHRLQVKMTATTGGDIGGPLPKTSSDVLTIKFRLSFDRYTP